MTVRGHVSCESRDPAFNRQRHRRVFHTGALPTVDRIPHVASNPFYCTKQHSQDQSIQNVVYSTSNESALMLTTKTPDASYHFESKAMK